MATVTKSLKTSLFIPVTLEQIAHGLRGLSKRELETLEILLDKEAIKTIREGMDQVGSGKLKKLL